MSALDNLRDLARKRDRADRNAQELRRRIDREAVAAADAEISYAEIGRALGMSKQGARELVLKARAQITNEGDAA